MEISDNQKTRDSFLLIDSSVIPKKNSNFSKKYKKIITFDLQSHRVLQMRSVKHHISDEFLEEKELAKIDAECIHFSQWYLNENYNEYLCYDEVNFGSLLKSDFNNFLIPFLRIFLSIKKILEEFPNTTLVCVPHIYKILNSLTNNLQVLDENDFEKNIEINKLQYKITNSISIDISKNNFQKLRKISDIITKVLVKKDNKKNKEKGIALIEFDPVKYETIFTESKRLICPAPIPKVQESLQNTIALLFTQLAIVQANFRSSNSFFEGLIFVTERRAIFFGSTISLSCIKYPPVKLLISRFEDSFE